MSSRLIVPIGFFTGSALFLIALVVDAAKGQPFRPSYLALAVAFALIGVVARPSSRAGG
ncbi:hypothetical protein D3C83_211090 [compost metagenome]